MAKLGIDFGTSNTTVSLVDHQSGQPKTLRIDGEEKIPSVLYFSNDEGEPIVGTQALATFEIAKDLVDPNEVRQILSGVFSGIKRDMNSSATIYLPNGESLSYAQLLAKFFKYIKCQAEESINNSTITDVCITHPVIFENDKKKVLLEAAHLAGFTNVKLLMEPVAASIGYESIPDYKNKGILVYDFGGGTFDLAFVKFDANGDKRMLPPVGDNNCGGEDIDKILYSEWDKAIFQQCGKHIANNEYDLDLPFLKKTCEHHKCFLSSYFAHKDVKSYTLKTYRHGKQVELNMSKERWEELISPIVDQTIDLTQKMLSIIRDEGFSVDKVLLIGGSSKLPLVIERLKEILPIPIGKVPEYDVAVALGAAVYINAPETTPKKCFCRKDGKELTTAIKFCPVCGTNNVRYDYKFDQ
ncbi:MAG: Hsp70 family protein [Bacteroides sp.]|nr:Hsp70 family protein [Bacteroides sp.]